jgi:hypothetical protein
MKEVSVAKVPEGQAWLRHRRVLAGQVILFEHKGPIWALIVGWLLRLALENQKWKTPEVGPAGVYVFSESLLGREHGEMVSRGGYLIHIDARRRTPP